MILGIWYVLHETVCDITFSQTAAMAASIALSDHWQCSPLAGLFDTLLLLHLFVDDFADFLPSVAETILNKRCNEKKIRCLRLQI